MANLTPATQGGDSQPLTKPTDWAIHMVTAAIKLSSGNGTPPSYTTPDDGRIDLLNTLNWYEAHDECEWPDFINMGFDFSQAMRFRRALVNDIFLALQKAGNIKVSGAPGTPDSAIELRGVKRTGAGVGVNRRLAERKRRCKHGDESDTEVASDNEDKPFWDDEGLLAEAMRALLDTFQADISSYFNGEKDPHVLATLVHDHIVRRTPTMSDLLNQ